MTENGKLAQRPRPLGIGKGQPDLFCLDEAAQIDLNPPIVERGLLAGLPPSSGRAIENMGSLVNMGTCTADSSLYLFPLGIWMEEFGRVGNGIYIAPEVSQSHAAICR